MLSVSLPTVSASASAVNHRKPIKSQENSSIYSFVGVDSFQSSRKKQDSISFAGVFGPLAVEPIDDELQNLEQHLPASQGQIAYFKLPIDQANNQFHYYIATAKDAVAAWQARRQQMQGMQTGNEALKNSANETYERLAELAQDNYPSSIYARH